MRTKSVFRFAPSPNGYLHLGHAYSALLNQQLAKQHGGRFLLRIEDIDTTRCTPALESALYEDLHWLGIEWEEPVRRQSEHFDDYRQALQILRDQNLIYPAFLSRGAVRTIINTYERDGKHWPRDPDGTPFYPIDERQISHEEAEQRMKKGEPFTWRLNMHEAMRRYGHDLHWHETGTGWQGETGLIHADPAQWGDVVIARSDIATSYHLAVVLDDAQQGISHIVRGRDLYHATAVHRLLQEILGLDAPLYHHHDLIVGNDGRKLSKSNGDTSLASLRASGLQPHDIQKMIGL